LETKYIRIRGNSRKKGGEKREAGLRGDGLMEKKKERQKEEGGRKELTTAALLTRYWYPLFFSSDSALPSAIPHPCLF